MKKENKIILDKIFRIVFDLEDSVFVESIRKINTPSWDSIAIVSFHAAIESEFNLTIEIKEFLEMTSYEMINLILEEKGL